MYKIGTRVIAKKGYEGNSKIINKSGRIVEIFKDKAIVEFDENIEGHVDYGHGKIDHCWLIPNDPEYLQKEEEKIIITANGNIVEACLYADGEILSASAKCSSEDDFDFIKGAEIATARLFEKVKEKRPIKLGTKVKIINSGYCYTTYTEWVSAYAPDFLANYCFDINPKDVHDLKKESFTIVAMEPHSTQKNLELVLIQDENRRCFLIETKGVKSND